MFTTLITYMVNNSLLFIAGGALAAVLAWAAWKRFEQYYREIRSPGELAFSIAKAVALMIVMGWVARQIWTASNAAVTNAVNSGSVQAAGQLAINVGQGLDYLMSDSGAIAPTGAMQEFSLPQFNVSTSAGGTGVTLPNLGTGNPGSGIATVLEILQTPGAVNTQNAPTATPLTVAAVNQAVVSANSNAPAQYTVKSGDSMFKIAANLLGDGNRYLELCRLNQAVVGRDCSNIRSGMVLSIPGATPNESPALTEWNNAITKWQVAPTPANKGSQQWDRAVTQWTDRQAPQPTAIALPQPTPTTVVMQVADPYAPASSPSEQATKDANTWNVGFGN